MRALSPKSIFLFYIIFIISITFIGCGSENKLEEPFKVGMSSITVRTPSLVKELVKVRPDTLINGYHKYESEQQIEEAFNSFASHYYNSDWISAPKTVFPEKGDQFIVIPVEIRDVSSLGETKTRIYDNALILKIKDLKITPSKFHSSEINILLRSHIFGDNYKGGLETLYNIRKDLPPARIYEPFYSYDKYLAFEITDELLNEELILSYKIDEDEFNVLIKKAGEDYKGFIDRYK